MWVNDECAEGFLGRQMALGASSPAESTDYERLVTSSATIINPAD